MRHTIELPNVFEIEGFLKHLRSKEFDGLTGHSVDEFLHFEFPSREDKLTENELFEIESLVLSYVYAPSWQPVKDVREILLKEADIEINKTEDNGLDASAIRVYRQALRDITKQANPESVVWPEKPWENQ